MRSLENDNLILDNRIKDLTELNLQMKNENRDLKYSNYKIEMERLEIKKNIEVLKSNMNNIENDFFDVTEKNENLNVENERLKNEMLTLKEKLKIYSRGVSKNALKTQNYKVKENYADNLINKFSFPKTDNFNLKKIRENELITKPSNIMKNLEKLDFSGLDNLGEKLRNKSN